MPESHSLNFYREVVRKASYWKFYFSQNYPRTSSRCLGQISYDKKAPPTVGRGPRCLGSATNFREGPSMYKLHKIFSYSS